MINLLYHWDNYPYSKILKYGIVIDKRGNAGKKKRRCYIDVVTAFDIETTWIRGTEHSIMYIWQYQIDNDTIIGRTWEQYLNFLQGLRAYIETIENCYLVTYVHNLSFEFQFLSGIYHFMPEEVFALKSRKVAKCELFQCFEYRCSYIHSNMSLEKYCEAMQTDVRKLSGEKFDYTKRRYPWTELSEYELAYCIHDVEGLVQAIKNEMEKDGDTLHTIPLTSTGYVRRDVKKAMRKASYNWIKQIQPDYDCYTLLREAFRGGDTHANRYFAGTILTVVKSIDRASSYPDVLMNCKFPLSGFYHIGGMGASELIEKYLKKGKALLLQVAFTSIRLLNIFHGCPYLTRDKSRKLRNGVIDNGRILEADYLETTITDVDLKIILNEYNFDDMVILDCYYARYGKLPLALKNEILNYYIKKTELKGINDENSEYFYMKSKNKLNSIYGLMAQNPLQTNVRYDDGEFTEELENPQQELEKANKKAYISYAWGVWCTAWARYRLHEIMWLIEKSGKADFVYCDTDSIKYIGELDISEYNKQRIDDSKKSGAFAYDKKGVCRYMGIYEEEQTAEEFVTLGSKKYCGKYGGKLKITVAGVSKKYGAIELEEKGGIEAFKEGFIWNGKAGGLEAVYNDDFEYPTINIDGRELKITKNVTLKPSTYTLGITAEYEKILEHAHEIFNESIDRPLYY